MGGMAKKEPQKAAKEKNQVKYITRKVGGQMKRYRVKVKVTICHVIDVRAVDEHDAQIEAEFRTIDGFDLRDVEDLSSEIIDDDGEF